MCGIGGFVLKSPPDFDGQALLKRLKFLQIHRGPDDDGIWLESDKKAGLCHNRLSILDLSKLGAQPMSTPDKRFTIVFNGEIYNWKALRQDLEIAGFKFKSNSDTEVVLYSYILWKDAFLKKLRGMFAFSIWDNQKKILFCARDRVGKKPFIFSETKRGFFFASEIPPLKLTAETVGINLEIDNNALAAFMLHNLRHIPEPATIYKGIRKLRAGHAIIVKLGKIVRYWRYWSPEPKKVINSQELRSIIEEAIKLRSVADVPVGALLSGGIDSTAIVNIMQKNCDQQVKTYAFGRNKQDEDIVRARYAAQKLGTDHSEFFFDPISHFENFKKIQSVYGEPIMLLPLIHTFELCKAIRRDGVKVVMNGNGADELFYGYTGHLNTARFTNIINMFGWTRGFIPDFKHPYSAVFHAPKGKRKAKLYAHKAHVTWPKFFRTDAIINLENYVARELAYWGQLFPNENYIDESNFCSIMIENSHSVTIAGDLPAMIQSVEMRSPFLDQEVVNAAMGIHYKQKVKGPQSGNRLKVILREAVEDLIPKKLFNAPKLGFGMGIQEKDLLLHEWRGYADAVFNEFPDMELFESYRIRKIWQNAKKENKVLWSEIAKLFAVGHWIKGSIL